MLPEVGLTNFTTEIIESTEPSLVEFYHPQCVPCRQIMPTLELVASHGRKVVKVNIEDDPELTRHYNVQAVPTLIVFKDGKAGPRLVGLKSHIQLMELMDAA